MSLLLLNLVYVNQADSERLGRGRAGRGGGLGGIVVVGVLGVATGETERGESKNVTSAAHSY